MNGGAPLGKWLYFSRFSVSSHLYRAHGRGFKVENLRDGRPPPFLSFLVPLLLTGTRRGGPFPAGIDSSSDTVDLFALLFSSITPYSQPFPLGGEFFFSICEHHSLFPMVFFFLSFFRTGSPLRPPLGTFFTGCWEKFLAPSHWLLLSGRLPPPTARFSFFPMVARSRCASPLFQSPLFSRLFFWW